MAQAKIDEFNAQVDAYNAFVKTLTAEEKAALAVEGDEDQEDDGKYRRQFFLWAKTEEDRLNGALKGIKHSKGMLETLQSSVKQYREKMQRRADGITSVKLMARYLKLPQEWRVFVAKRFGVKHALAEKAWTEDDVSVLLIEYDEDDKEYVEIIDKFVALLQEVEETQ